MAAGYCEANSPLREVNVFSQRNDGSLLVSRTVWVSSMDGENSELFLREY